MTDKSWDVVVVGSGAGGGMSAYVLAKAGLRVLMIEAGRDYDPISETPMFESDEKAPLRGAPTPDKPFGFYDATIGGGWDVPGEPYVVAEGSAFKWYRTRMLGGRTNHWGRVSLRFGPYDFAPRSRDGLGVDWPIGYSDVAPYYDRVERLIGVLGGQEQFENEPPSVGAQPPPPKRPSERLIERGFASMDIPVAANRAAILTRPLGDRAACIYATPCMRGCSIKANFQSTTVLIPPARETGNLEIRTDCLVDEVRLDKDGKASGVGYVDRKTGERQFAAGRAVVLAASACESARILLNSKSARYPNGLANDSGQVGRNLMDSVGTYTVGQVPALEGAPPRNDDGIWLSHIYVPWWGYKQQAAKALDFPRGYHIELFTNRVMPDMFYNNATDFCDTPYGLGLREEMQRKFGSIVVLTGRGEMIPNADSYCEIDPVTRDRWGIPALRFHWKWGESEIRMAAHMRQTFSRFFGKVGGKILFGGESDGAKAITTGGEVIHEVGTTRMGASARSSVVNQHGQSWTVPNLYIADGGVFASSPHKNPTLTILALAWRSTDHLVARFRKGAI